MTQRASLSFDEIMFGLRDARREALKNRDLLLTGYFDLHGAYQDVFDGDRWLVLGYKGSGKSALAQHLRLRAEGGDEVVVRTLLLNELSFEEFGEVIPEPIAWHSRYTKVWSLALWVQLLDMLRSDKSSPSRVDPWVQSALAALETARLLPAHDLATSIRDYAHHAFDVPGLRSAAHTESGRTLALSKLVGQLQEVGCRYKSGKKFILVIDGTDEIFTGEQVLYEVVAALIESASALNDTLMESGLNAKVVILCRTDLFNRLPGANKNKHKGDVGVELNWYEEAKDPKMSALASLANQKARVADKRIRNIFIDYLPRTASYNKSRHRPTLDLLLDYTRHTPRDLLQLLTCIGQVHRATGESKLQKTVSTTVVAKGLRRYSRTYFAAEIEDEVWGHLQIDERAAIVPILTTIGRSEFSPDEFERVADRSFPELNATRLLEVLYSCSAIGQIRRFRNSEGQERTRVTFKYRNPQSHLNLAENLLVHNGWRTKLNIMPDGSEREDSASQPAPQSSREGLAVRQRRRSRRNSSPAGEPLTNDEAT